MIRMKHTPVPPFPFTIGDTLRVIVIKGHGVSRWEFPAVPCTVIRINHSGEGEEIVVKLLAKACRGWEAGDTYRTHAKWLRQPLPVTPPPPVVQQKPPHLIDRRTNR